MHQILALANPVSGRFLQIHHQVVRPSKSIFISTAKSSCRQKFHLDLQDLGTRANLKFLLLFLLLE